MVYLYNGYSQPKWALHEILADITQDFGRHLDPQRNTCSDGEPSSKNKSSSEQSSAYGDVCYFSTLIKH